MPEEPPGKHRPHPMKLELAARAEEAIARGIRAAREFPYAELEVTSNFTFLTGASHPDELVQRAAALGYRAIAITDTNTVAGVVRAHVAAKEVGIQLVIGCRLKFVETPAGPPVPLSLLVYPTDLAAYGRLCRLLTLGKRRAPKGECHLHLEDLDEYAEGLLAVAAPTRTIDERTADALRRLRTVFDRDRLSLAVSRNYHQHDAEHAREIAALGAALRIPLVATNDAHYHAPERRSLQDVVTCIRHGCTLEQAGFRLHPNAERHLKEPEEMHRLFGREGEGGWGRDALARTLEIAERCRGFSLEQLRYNYPDEEIPDGGTPMEHLRRLTYEGARERYPEEQGGITDKVRASLEHELAIIEQLNYAPYFLTVHDLVRFARSRGILCQGRGAAANSAVCYCLGVTSVDPARSSMLFERFVSVERNEPPDIDIDFEHERREEVIQYLYQKYGRDRAALTAEVISYRGRSAVRDVGKAMGLSLDVVEALAGEIDWWTDSAEDAKRITALGLNPRDPHLRSVLAHTAEIMGFPRHLSQHVGGFVITQSPLSELVPIENAAMEDRTVIEWDKDDIDALGMLKVDVLGLGMLTCLRKCMDLVRSSDGPPHNDLSLATIPAEDPATYDMICRADTIGVFQIESRAQMSMLPRLRPRCYYDLVIEVAIVRPGPIQGKMVHPYIRRRNGEEPVEFASPEVKRVLGRTLGVPLFQEQCMALAVSAAGFTPGEADQLRRAMAAWTRSGKAILKFEAKLIKGMTDRGYTRAFAEQVFQQISGFSGYGFPESHAASFAILVYASCWLKCHKPAAFAAALINSQPMGFYQPAQIVRDAKEHGVEVREIDVNSSAWDCTLEPSELNSGAGSGGAGSGGASSEGAGGAPASHPAPHAVRLGMRLVKGLSEAHAHAIARHVRTSGPFTTLDSLHRAIRAGGEVPVKALRYLARADAFGSMGLKRQAALWTLERFKDDPLPLFDGADDGGPGGALALDHESAMVLPRPSPYSEVAADYNRAQLSLKAHPVSFAREELERRGVTPCSELQDETRSPAGRKVSVAGLVLVRQRPGTASGIIFMTIEDETGIANLVVFPQVFERFRGIARHAPAIICTGHIERQGEVVHVKAQRIEPLPPLALHAEPLASLSRDFH